MFLMGEVPLYASGPETGLSRGISTSCLQLRSQLAGQCEIQGCLNYKKTPQVMAVHTPGFRSMYRGTSLIRTPPLSRATIGP